MQRRVPVVLEFREADLKRAAAALILAIVLVAARHADIGGITVLTTWVAYAALLCVAYSFHRAYRAARSEHPHDRVVAHFSDEQIIELLAAAWVYLTTYEAMASSSSLWWGVLFNGLVNLFVLGTIGFLTFRARARREEQPR
jgi:hypothetical protein